MGKEEAQEPFLPTSTPRPSEDLEEYVDETVLHKQKSDGGEYIPKKKGWRFLQLFILVLIITGVGFNLSHIGKSAIKGKSTNKDKIRRDAILEKSKNYEWDEITPSKDLVYYTCFDNFQCARLLVPLDWKNPKNGKEVAIAITKYPAKVPEDSEEWGGPLLTNPGGPGGSGTLFTLQAGEALQNLAGSQFSIIGFDPRGVSQTTPYISCFDSVVAGALWWTKWGGKLLGSGGGEEFGEAYIRAQITSKICGDTNKELLNFVGTTSVARDMLAISDKSWKGKKKAIVVEKDGKKRKQGLRYWGFSYGSVLGVTFATMFPDRVERLIVDGIVDASEYYNADWTNSLADTDLVMDSFFAYCHLAGPDKCPFYTGTSPTHISDRLKALLTTLRTAPIPVYPSQSPSAEPDFVTYSDIQYLLFASLYTPIDSFPRIAEILTSLESLNATSYLTSPFNNKLPFPLHCPNPTLPSPGSGADSRINDAGNAIRCSDGSPVTDSLSEFKSYYERLTALSSTAAPFWPLTRLFCLNWPGRSVERITKIGTKKTYKPILFIGNTLDPVTPLRNAHTMSKLFPGSVVLKQDSEGHCSLASPSLCTAEVVGAYFRTGLLPSEGTVCKPLSRPFGVETDPSRLEKREMNESDRVVVESMEKAGKWLVNGNGQLGRRGGVLGLGW